VLFQWERVETPCILYGYAIQIGMMRSRTSDAFRAGYIKIRNVQETIFFTGYRIYIFNKLEEQHKLRYSDERERVNIRKY